MEKKSLVMVAVLSFTTFATQAQATDPWPGEAWQQSTVLTSLDTDFQKNLSGSHWNDVTRTLWVCLNGPGKFWALVQDVNGNFQVATQNGRRGEWNAAGDLEAITQVDLEEPSVYVMNEAQGLIQKYNVSTYGVSVLERQWDITPYVPVYDGSSGPEGMTFVPDESLEQNGFVDANGAAYTSQNGMGGLMMVAHQKGGAIYAFDLDPNSNLVEFVGAYKTLRGESSGLEFDRSSGKLFIWHNTGSNYLEVTDLTSYVDANNQRRFTSVKEYLGPKGGNLESIALTPSASGDNWFFITDDDNQNGAALMFFDSFTAEIFADDVYTTNQRTDLAVGLPGVAENDFGANNLILLDEPLHGSLEGLLAGDSFDGSFIYHPDPNFAGIDVLTYASADGVEQAQIEIQIKPVRTLTIPITAGLDDVEQRADGTVYTNSTDLELVTDGNVQTVALKFNNINLEPDAKIVKAYLQFATDETVNQNTNLIIAGEASANPAAFSTARNNVSSRAQTAANVQWQPESWLVLNEVGTKQQTPNLSPIIEELIGSANWQAGSSMVFIISGSGKRVAQAYEVSPALAPRLVIEVEDDAAPEASSYTVDYRVSSSINDVEEQANGSVNTNSTDLELVTDASVQTVGMRFEGVSIPAGAVITNAYLQFAVDETSNTATNLTIQAEDIAQAAAFTTGVRNVSSRSLTSAQVAWTPEVWNVIGEAGLKQRTPNLASIVQELVDRADWQNGSAAVFVIKGSGKRVAEAYDGSPAQAPMLHVEYVVE